MNVHSLGSTTSKVLNPEAIAVALGGAEKTGPVTWRAFCPVCGYRKPFSVFWEDDEITVGFHCYSDTHDQASILNELRGRGLLDGDYDPALAATALLLDALTIWERGVPLEGNAAAAYLASRGLRPPWPSTLRADVFGTTKKGADVVGALQPGPPPPYAFGLVCLVECPRRGVLGTHTINLNNGGDRKARHYRRRGNLDGGGVWLGTPGDELVVAEGLETTLSAMMILGVARGVAALGARGMTLLNLPDNAERVIIAADNDEEGRYAARDAQERWADEGRAVRILSPDKPDTDFNDLLRERSRQ